MFGTIRSVSFGAWWCAIFTFISGLIALHSKNRYISALVVLFVFKLFS